MNKFDKNYDNRDDFTEEIELNSTENLRNVLKIPFLLEDFYKEIYKYSIDKFQNRLHKLDELYKKEIAKYNKITQKSGILEFLSRNYEQIKSFEREKKAGNPSTIPPTYIAKRLLYLNPDNLHPIYVDKYGYIYSGTMEILRMLYGISEEYNEPLSFDIIIKNENKPIISMLFANDYLVTRKGVVYYLYLDSFTVDLILDLFFFKYEEKLFSFIEKNLIKIENDREFRYVDRLMEKVILYIYYKLYEILTEKKLNKKISFSITDKNERTFKSLLDKFLKGLTSDNIIAYLNIANSNLENPILDINDAVSFMKSVRESNKNILPRDILFLGAENAYNGFPVKLFFDSYDIAVSINDYLKYFTNPSEELLKFEATQEYLDNLVMSLYHITQVNVIDTPFISINRDIKVLNETFNLLIDFIKKITKVSDQSIQKEYAYLYLDYYYLIGDYKSYVNLYDKTLKNKFLYEQDETNKLKYFLSKYFIENSDKNKKEVKKYLDNLISKHKRREQKRFISNLKDSDYKKDYKSYIDTESTLAFYLLKYILFGTVGRSEIVRMVIDAYNSNSDIFSIIEKLEDFFLQNRERFFKDYLDEDEILDKANKLFYWIHYNVYTALKFYPFDKKLYKLYNPFYKYKIPSLREGKIIWD